MAFSNTFFMFMCLCRSCCTVPATVCDPHPPIWLCSVSVLNMSATEQEIVEYFKRTDLDGNGRIDAREFKAMLMRMGILLASSDEAKLFNAMDGSHTGYIGLQDFIKNYDTIKALERKAEVGRCTHACSFVGERI